MSEVQVCDPGLSNKEASYLQVKKPNLGPFLFVA